MGALSGRGNSVWCHGTWNKWAIDIDSRRRGAEYSPIGRPERIFIVRSFATRDTVGGYQWIGLLWRSPEGQTHARISLTRRERNRWPSATGCNRSERRGWLVPHEAAKGCFM